MSTWWSDALKVYMSLNSILLEHENFNNPNKTWMVAGHTFRLRDKDEYAHSDEMEEQLWAMRKGLA